MWICLLSDIFHENLNFHGLNYTDAHEVNLYKSKPGMVLN